MPHNTGQPSGIIPDSAVEKEEDVPSDGIAEKEDKGFKKGSLERREDTDLDTYELGHKCLRLVLIFGTIALVSFVAFLGYKLAYLISVYIDYIVGNIKDVNGIRQNIESLLSHIWTIVSGSSFLIVLIQALMIGFRKNSSR